MLLATCAIGKGDAFGINACIYPVFSQSSKRRQEESIEDFPISVAKAIRERWATLSSNVIPMTEGSQLLKISRHFDREGRVWTWIGFYQHIEFQGEGRSGHYFGTGIAFCDHSISGDIGNFLDHQFDRLAKATLRDGQMYRSIFEIDLSQQYEDITRDLIFTPLVKDFDGVRPDATTGLFNFQDSWTTQDVQKMVRAALSGPNLYKIGGCFFGNWGLPPENSQFYMSDNEGTIASDRETASEDNLDLVSLPISSRSRDSSFTQDQSNSSGSSIKEAELADIISKIDGIDKKISELSRQIQRSLPNKNNENAKKFNRTLCEILKYSLAVLTIALLFGLIFRYTVM